MATHFSPPILLLPRVMGDLRILAAAGLFLAALTGCADKVRINNASLPNEWGILVDGTRSTGPVNDVRYRSTSTQPACVLSATIVPVLSSRRNSTPM